MAPLYAHVFFLCCFSAGLLCSATDTITNTQSLQDPQAIVSKNGAFKLGFFSPPNSPNRYVGIWFNKVPIRTVVWVANRNRPITDSSVVLRIAENGDLELRNGQNESIWSSNALNMTMKNATAQLQDSGNLVLLQGNITEARAGKQHILWQSFDHPQNTYLPAMIATIPVTPNQKSIIFRSWKSPSDPSEGNFSIGMSTIGLPQFFTWNNGLPYWRSGPWDGNTFIGIINGDNALNAGFTLVTNPGSGTVNMSSMAHQFLNYELEPQGTILERFWDGDHANKNWTIGWSAPLTPCDSYATCGAFGTCNHKNVPICRCLKGFQPKNKDEWRTRNWSSGCIRKTALQCGIQGEQQDRFLTLQKMKVPDNIEMLSAFKQDDCRSQCLNNCSCFAYAYHLNIGCMTWSKELIDIQEFPSGGVDLYLRLASSELEDKAHRKTAITITSAVVIATTFSAIFIFFIWRRIARQGKRVGRLNNYKFGDNIGQLELQEPPLYTFDVLRNATNNFQEANQLGKGGFGPVYKGILGDGQEIAVKRLSRASGQGLEEFMNEVVVISKLQHRNLVRLLGCCVEGDEKMLVYEYMPNIGLDGFLFDCQKRELLTWEKRFNIIEGICRGLLYLHRDSRLRIIHRDLKAGNILLDKDLNPKISDFGMARIFGGNQDEANTRRVVGTYGYISPEYALGQFSEKSDVYSLGVMLLEIVSGRKTSTFHHSEQSLTLLGYAWKLWKEGNIILFIDPILSEPQFQADIKRRIQVGLLCVQERAKDRPNIATIISMLDSDTEHLPNPRKPSFTYWDISSDDQQTKNHSFNYCSISTIEGR